MLNKSQRPATEVTFMDASESIKGNGRTDNGSDQSIVSSTFPERAVLIGIDKITRNDTMTLQAALKDSENAHSFMFSR